ncbi:MAG: argininosuccinate lyase [Clostridia bacterium]
MVLWEGRFKKELDSRTNTFNSSIYSDSRMFKHDIIGSIAHSKMLAKQKIITDDESKAIIDELIKISDEIENEILKIDYKAEDIHMFIESELTKRLGSIGKKLHTARSRNDQVALDIRLYLRDEILEIKKILKELLETILDKAEKNVETVMPGYTHLQRAQPITFAHHLMAYAEMILRDIDRLNDTFRRTNIMPLGSCALAGTTHNIDRKYVAEILEFDDITKNSLDGVSDRDFVIELASDISIIMMHLSRFSEEIILWCSWEFKFIELDDAFSTGSSIMPQKKNPDITELIRGKTGRVYGNLLTLLTMMKGLPLAYNKDMQEDKEAIFGSIDTVKICLQTLIPMIQTFNVNEDNMKKAALKGFINATDCADYLVKKGVPFREAYKITGNIVAYCIENNKDLETLTIDEYKKMNENFSEDIYVSIDLNSCLMNRNVEGGPAPEQVIKRINEMRSLKNITYKKDKNAYCKNKNYSIK